MKKCPRSFRVWRGYVHFFILLGFLVLAVRLAWIQSYQHDAWRAVGERMERRRVEIEPERGMIMDRAGRALAVSVRRPSAYVNPRATPMEQRDDIARSLAGILSLDAARVRGLLDHDKYFVWLKRNITESEAARLNEAELPGAGVRDEMSRAYPCGRLAAHLLGYAGIDGRGLAGVEEAYDDLLRGVPGRDEVRLDGRGLRMAASDRPLQPPVSGRSVLLTIDSDLQRIAEEELAAACVTHKPERACVVVMDPWNGDVLAMAGWPSFATGDFPEVPAADRRIMAVSECVEPGSTFKPFVASLALEHGRVSPDTRFDCHQGAYRIGSRTLHDAHGFGVLSVRDIVAYSSNIGMAQVGARLQPMEIYEGLRRFGFGRTTGIGLRGESSGLLHHPKDWSKLTISSIPMGQEVAVSPLQLAAGFCVFANGGWLVPPRILLGVADAETPGVIRPAPRRAPERVLSEATARLMRADLLSKVVEYGTGRASAIEGYALAGKTGTAQIAQADARGYEPGAYVAAFVGIVPVDAPRYVIAMVVRKPSGISHYGGVVAAPAVSKIAERALSALRVPRALKKDERPLAMSGHAESP
jgi:cell division protein FtsI (penicillin-binding protein 3)